MTFLLVILTFAALSIVVLFQPEIRRFLKDSEQVNSLAFSNTGNDETLKTTAVVEEIVKACKNI